MKNLRTALLAGLCLAALSPAAWAQNFQRNPQVIDKPEYPTKDVNVIELNILDYNSNANKGSENVTSLIQNALNFLGDNNHQSETRRTGGVLYLPAGQYLVDGSIVVPKGVTIRGDWKTPVKGQAIGGTIIKVSNRYKDAASETGPFGQTNHKYSVFRMEPASQLKDLAFWWVDQNASNPSAYPPAVTMGRENYWGNEGCNVRNITLVNAYEGVEVSELNGEAASHSVYHIYGTPLYRGIVIDHLQDVSRVDHCDFSPLYWAGSGLSNAGDARSWMRRNGVAYEIRRNDWSYVCNSSADGYKWGFLAIQSHEDNHWAPNGHNYNLNFTDCEVGFYMQDTNGYGLMIAHSSTSNCDYGMRFPAGNANAVQLLDCNFQGSKAGIRSDIDASPIIQIEQCHADKVDIMGGQLLSDDCDITYAHIGSLGRCLISDSRVGTLKNESVYECVENGTKNFTVKKAPVIADDVMVIRTTRPSKTSLYTVSQGEYILAMEQSQYGADRTQDIQNALNQASANGGGIVYLPAGHYRCNSNLTIPTGVELRGSSDVSAFSHGQGSILEVYASEGNENADPFITMAERSGMRGITINYPTQDKSIWNGSKIVPKKFPYSVRGNKDVYIVNLALRGAYRGVDLFTNKCDNHYVDYISGHAFVNVVRVGGMSQNGTISNIQVNTIVFANGNEGKFGSWPNINVNNYTGAHQAFYQQNADDLDFFIVGDCRGQNMYNNFLYGCNKGIIFQSDGQGGATFTSLGNAVDGVVNTFVMRQTYGDVDMINTQLVALNNNHSANFFTAESGYQGTVNMYGTNNWGSGDTFARVQSGTINFILSNLDQMGSQNSFQVTAPGKFNMINFYVRNNRNSNANSNVGVYSGIYTPAGDGTFGTFSNILSSTWAFDASKAAESFIDRTGWKAIASNDLTGSSSAYNMLDGNAGSRWTTSEGQNAATHWVAIFPSQNINGYPSASVRANTLVLDFMGSTGYNDAPEHYKVQVLDQNGNDDTSLNVNGNRWRTIAEGDGGSAVLPVVFDEQDIHGIRVIQTGTRTNWWSVTEANLALLSLDDDDTPVTPPEPEKKYDLEVKAVSWTPGDKEITADQNVSGFQVVVENVGENDAEENATVTVTIDSASLGSAVIRGLAAGEKTTVDVAGSYLAVAGGHTVTAKLSGMSNDENSDNNSRVRTFNATGGVTTIEPETEYVTNFSEAPVNGTSLVIRRVFWQKTDASGNILPGQPIRPGDKVKFSAEIYNNGSVATKATKHGLLFETWPAYDPKYWSDDSKTSMAPGETRILTTCGGSNNNGGMWTASEGESQFRVMLDDQNELGVRNLSGVTITPIYVNVTSSPATIDFIDMPTGADNISEVVGVEGIDADMQAAPDVWFTIQGIRINAPSAPGIYIHNGKKVIK